MDVIKRQFLSCVPINQVNYEIFNENTTWEDQELFLKNTIYHPLNIKHPLKCQYQISFMKKLINHLEILGVEIHNDIYSIHCKLLERQSDGSKYAYKHYISNDESFRISLKESVSLISDGTTGLCTWEAAYALAEWCLHNSSMLNGKHVLELGSGVGFTGIAVARYCNVSSIFLTDCHSNVLKMLEENVELNFPSNTKLKKSLPKSIGSFFKVNDTEVGVLDLPWEELNDKSEITFENNPDIIIAADVVYDSSIFNDLINAFKYFCNLNRDCQIILACTIRNEDTLNNFLDKLGKNKFTIKEESYPPSKFVTNVSKPPVIFK